MINSVKGSVEVSQVYNLKDRANSDKAAETQSTGEQAAVLELGNASSIKATYSKPAVKGLNSDEIYRLKEVAQRTYSSLRQLVEELLSRQGKKFNDVLSGREILQVDEEARAKAAEMISEDGELGVKAVSERIVSFAKAISGNDPSKAKELRAAIVQGFKEAERILGGKLPDISQKTYDEVMRKLDEWEEIKAE